MPKSVEMLPLQEIEAMSTFLLQDQVERLQEENWRIEAQLEESYSILEDLTALDSLEEIEEIIGRARRLLEEKPLLPSPF